MVEVVEQPVVREREAPVELDEPSRSDGEIDFPKVDELGKVLLKARDIIRTNGWCQNAYMDFDDPEDWVEMKATPKVCVLGALSVACGGSPDEEFYNHMLFSMEAVRKRLGVPEDLTIFDWNDTTDRTQQEVEERLERAAYKL